MARSLLPLAVRPASSATVSVSTIKAKLTCKGPQQVATGGDLLWWTDAGADVQAPDGENLINTAMPKAFAQASPKIR